MNYLGHLFISKQIRYFNAGFLWLISLKEISTLIIQKRFKMAFFFIEQQTPLQTKALFLKT